MNMVEIDGDIEELRNQMERTWGLLLSLKTFVQNNDELLELGLLEALSNAELRLSRAISMIVELVNIMPNAAPFHRLLALDYEVEFLMNEFTSMTERGKPDIGIVEPAEYTPKNRALEFGLDGIFYMLYHANELSSKVILDSKVIPKDAA